MIDSVPQPPAQHSTRDPWPQGFAVPAVVERLRGTAAAHGWDWRTGYSRAYEKRGRGNVGGTGDARWVCRHFVSIQVRAHDRDPLINRAIYGADVVPGPLSWTVVSVQIAGISSNITSFRRLIQGAATVDAARTPVRQVPGDRVHPVLSPGIMAS